jgi:hypothetical protein
VALPEDDNHHSHRRGNLKSYSRETVFYWGRAATVAIQWFGEHVSTIEVVFSVGSVQRSYLKNKRRYSS